MKYTKHLFYFILFFIYSLNVFSNNNIQYYFRTLDISNGLSQNTVYDILQDRQGFMWFGTKDGLNRYDGLSFRIFRKENDQLGNNFINTLHEDKDGKIWIGTDAGVYIYYPESEVFETFNIPTADGKIIERSVTVIRSDYKGDIWIGVDSQGLFHYDTRHSKLANYLSPFSDAGVTANVTYFWFEPNGTCWVSLYDDNLYYTDDNFNTLHPYTLPDGKQPFKNDIVNKLLYGPDNKLYIGASKGGLKAIDLGNKELFDLLPIDKYRNEVYVRELAFYKDKELWIGTETGIYIYNTETHYFTHLETAHGDPYSLADNAVYSLYKDREGGMWMGSYFGGINYYPRQYTYFEKFYPRNNFHFLGRRVREFCEGNDGTIWIGTEDRGLFNYNPATGNMKPFLHPNIYKNVHGLCLDGDYLWVGTFSRGVNRIDLRNNSVKTYTKGVEQNRLNSNDIFSIYRNRSGQLWLGTTSGAHIYNREKDDFTRLPEMNGIFVYDIKEDTKGNMWLATYANGVYRYEPDKQRWTNYTHKEDIPGSLPYDKVLSVYIDTKERIWFTTQGWGFCQFDPQTETFINYDSSVGFLSNVIYHIIEDNSGLFWITTNEGLVRFNPETKEMKVFTTTNGLLSNQFNYQSGYKDKNGKIYFGSINGFIAFDPSSFVDNTIVPPVVITDFLLFNKRVTAIQEDSPLQKSIVYSDRIELKANQNSFSFSMASLSYQAPEMNKLMYKLEGFDREWYLVDQAPVITYSNLPYGSYKLMVKGSNSDGKWNEKATILYVRIHPPFYLSIWAYLIYTILLLLIITGLVYAFKQRTAKKNIRLMEKFQQKKERELYNAKIDFFTNVAHEIRTPLTLIKSPLENILNYKKVDTDVRDDLMIMSQNTNRLLNLTNQLLDFRKTENQGFKLSYINCNVSTVIKETYTRFTPLAREKGVEFSIELPDKDIYAHVDREALTKVISNLFTNALKYTDSYIHALLSLDEEEKTFRLLVSNDGKIVPELMREEIFRPFVQYKEDVKDVVAGTGIGLALSRSLAELHGGTLRMDDNLNCNRFILTLPIEQQQVLSLSMDKESKEIGMKEEQETVSTINPTKYTILIVEDNLDMLSYISRQLSSSYTVLKAKDGIEALEILNENYVSLVISDIMMPRMDGLELCNRLKSDLQHSHIPLILLTAKTNVQSKIEGMQSGADVYIEKPFSVEYLKACIANLLNNREKLRTAFTQSPFTLSKSMAMTKADENFLKTLNEVVLSNMQNPDFCLDDMANILNMSRSSLNRKIKGVLDMTPNDYIRLERLKKAAQLLKEGECKVNEVCYMIGFNTPSYFTKCFQKQFGMLPKDFTKKSS